MSYEFFTQLLSSIYRALERVASIDQWSFASIDQFLNTNSGAVQVQSIFSELALIVSLIAGGVLVYVGIQKRQLKAVTSQSPVLPVSTVHTSVPGDTQWRMRWNVVRAGLDSAREADWKVAVMEADKLIDDALAKAGFGGSTFGDRLTNIAPGQLVSLDGIWWAHKIRNRLAHETDYFLRYTEARQAVGYYEAALSELKLL